MRLSRNGGINVVISDVILQYLPRESTDFSAHTTSSKKRISLYNQRVILYILGGESGEAPTFRRPRNRLQAIPFESPA